MECYSPLRIIFNSFHMSYNKRFFTNWVANTMEYLKQIVSFYIPGIAGAKSNDDVVGRVTGLGSVAAGKLCVGTIVLSGSESSGLYGSSEICTNISDYSHSIIGKFINISGNNDNI